MMTTTTTMMMVVMILVMTVTPLLRPSEFVIQNHPDIRIYITYQVDKTSLKSNKQKRNSIFSNTCVSRLFPTSSLAGFNVWMFHIA